MIGENQRHTNERKLLYIIHINYQRSWEMKAVKQKEPVDRSPGLFERVRFGASSRVLIKIVEHDQHAGLR